LILLLAIVLPNNDILSSFLASPFQIGNAQIITQKDLVTYQKQSNFIKEFKIPLQEHGLKGITTDSHGNAWFYHLTNQTSKILKFDPLNRNFTQYNIIGKTRSDNAIINLAGGQLAYDEGRNAIWFTDARINSIGKLDIKSGKIQLFEIPTPKSGPMGITLSPDSKSIWFAEITGNKIAKLDITSSNNNSKILEYPVTLGAVAPGQDTGPTFLTFDKSGILWVTMSYTHSLLRVEPWMLVPSSNSSTLGGMSNFTLQQGSDIFSPFGIAVSNSASNNSTNMNTTERMTTTKIGENNSEERIVLSDHGSSRILISSGNIDTNPLQSYISYWTSPSQVYPATLPGQIVMDKSQNVYFPEHGGNRISKISLKTGIMTEYDIPTGPLSTTIFAAISQDGKKMWFTEWASNKIAYLDTTLPVPLGIQITKDNRIFSTSSSPLILKRNLSPQIIDVYLLRQTGRNNADIGNSSNIGISSRPVTISLNDVDISLVGMSDSGIGGIQYTAVPQTTNMTEHALSKMKIALKLGNTTESSNNNMAYTSMPRPGIYNVMIRASAFERDGLLVSLLYPIPVELDIPAPKLQRQYQQQDNNNNIFTNTKQNPFSIASPTGILRQLAFIATIGLIGFIIYIRVKRFRGNKKKSTTTEKITLNSDIL
jgi:virginiamycin B lyase